MDEKLNLIALSNAIKTFKRALDEYAKDESNEFVRDSCIQRFEYCYDLSTKTITRHLEIIANDPSEIKTMAFLDRIRQGYSAGILKNSVVEWKQYRKNRTDTTHDYNLEKTTIIAQQLKYFYQELAFLLEALQQIYETKI